MLRVTRVVRRLTPLILALALVAGLALTPVLTPSALAQDADDGDGYQPIAVGTAAPNFTLQDLDGESHSLSDLAGEPAVLVFFRGAW